MAPTAEIWVWPEPPGCRRVGSGRFSPLKRHGARWLALFGPGTASPEHPHRHCPARRSKCTSPSSSPPLRLQPRRSLQRSSSRSLSSTTTMRSTRCLSRETCGCSVAREIGPPRNRDPPRRSRAGAGEGRQWSKAILVCRARKVTSPQACSLRSAPYNAPFTTLWCTLVRCNPCTNLLYTILPLSCSPSPLFSESTFRKSR